MAHFSISCHPWHSAERGMNAHYCVVLGSFWLIDRFQGFQLNVAQSTLSSSRDTATHSPLPSKAAAPAVAVAAKEVSSAPAPKAFDISAVPGVKVSGPLLRSCSKAVSTIAGDADMVWFLSPGKIASSRACSCPIGLMRFLQWTTKRCSCLITRRSSRNLWISAPFKKSY